MDEKVKITLIKNPFDFHRSREIYDIALSNRLPIRSYLEEFNKNLEDYEFIVSVNGKIIDDKIIDTYPILDGDNIVFVPIPQDGDGGGKAVRTLGLLALTVLSFGYDGALGGALGITSQSLATAVGSTIIMGVGGLLINAIVPATSQDLSALPYSPDFKESATYSWQAMANPNREGIHIPLTIGKAKITPPILSKYITLNGDKQYLNLLFCLGYGEIDSYENIKINGNSINNYENVTIYFEAGTASQPSLPYFDDTYIETPVLQKLTTQLTYTSSSYQNWLLVNNDTQTNVYSNQYTTNEGVQKEATKIAFTVNFPHGLFGSRVVDDPVNEGETFLRSATIRANFRILYFESPYGAFQSKNIVVDAFTTEPFNWVFNVDNLPEAIYGAYLVFLNFQALGSTGYPIGNWETDTRPYVAGTTDYSDNIGIRILYFSWANTNVSYNTTSNSINRLGLAFTCPNGLYGINPENGALINETVRIRTIITAVSGVYEVGQDLIITAASRNPVRRMLWFDNLPFDFYQVSVRFIEDPGSTVNEVNDTYFDYMQEVISNDFTYPGLALLGMRILATDQLSGNIPRIELTQSRISEVINGVGRNVSNPAWACLLLLTNEEFGLGESFSKIIMDDFTEWATFCSNNGLYIGITYDVAMDAPAALSHISKVGRGRIVQRGTKWGVVVDQPSTDVQVFNIGNTENFEEIWLETSDRANVLEVTYYDKDKDFDNQTMEVPFEEFTSADNEVKASETLIACTSKQIAYNHAKFLLNCNHYLRKVIKFEAGLDSIGMVPNDIFYFQNDVTQWGSGGRLESGSTVYKLELDQYVTIKAGFNYSVLVRFSGTDVVETRSILNLEGTTKTLHVQSRFNGTPGEDDVYIFGITTDSFKLFRCLSIEKTSDLNAKITALEYNADVYNLSALPEEYESTTDLPAISDLKGRCITDYNPWGSASLSINLSWKGYVIKWDVYRRSVNDSGSTTPMIKIATVYQPFYIDQNVEYGDIYIYTVSDGIGITQESVSVSTYRNDITPQDVENFQAVQYKDYIIFSWDKNPEPYVNGYEIRYGYDWVSGETIIIISGSTQFNWPLPITGTYEFNIKAVSSSGKRSENATSESITVYNTPQSLHAVYTKDYLIEDYLDTVNSPYPTLDPDDVYIDTNNFTFNRYDLDAYDAEQDFIDDYVETDTNGKLTIASDSITAENLNRSEVAYLLRDYGEDYFSADFKTRFKVNISNLVSSSSASSQSTSSSSQSSSSSSSSASSGNIPSLSSSSSSESSSSSSGSSSQSTSLSESSSSSSSSSLDLSFSSSSSSISFSSQSSSSSSQSSGSSSSQSSSNSSSSSISSQSSSSQSSSSSSSSSLSTSSSSSSSSSLTYLASNDGPILSGIVNTENDFETATDDSGEYGVGIIIDDGQFKLIERSAGSSTLSTGYYFALNKDYYIQFRRVEPHSIGDPLGQYGYIYADIYNDSDYTNVIKELSLQLTEYPRLDMQYILPISSYNNSNPNSCSLILSDMKVARPSLEYTYDNEDDPYFSSTEIDLTYPEKFRARLYNQYRSDFNDPTDTTPGFTDRTDQTYPYDTDTNITSEITFHYEYAYFIAEKTEPYYSKVGGAYSDWKRLSSNPVDIPYTRYFKWRMVPEFENSNAIDLKFYQIKLVIEVDETVYRINNQTISASGTTITFADYGLVFFVEVDVGAIVVNASPVTATPVITSKTLGAVTIKVMDKNDTAIEEDVNIIIQGY